MANRLLKFHSPFCDSLRADRFRNFFRHYNRLPTSEGFPPLGRNLQELLNNSSGDDA